MGMQVVLPWELKMCHVGDIVSVLSVSTHLLLLDCVCVLCDSSASTSIWQIHISSQYTSLLSVTGFTLILRLMVIVNLHFTFLLITHTRRLTRNISTGSFVSVIISVSIKIEHYIEPRTVYIISNKINHNEHMVLTSLSQTYQIYFYEHLLFLTNVEQTTYVYKHVFLPTITNIYKRLLHLWINYKQHNIGATCTHNNHFIQLH